MQPSVHVRKLLWICQRSRVYCNDHISTWFLQVDRLPVWHIWQNGSYFRSTAWPLPTIKRIFSNGSGPGISVTPRGVKNRINAFIGLVCSFRFSYRYTPRGYQRFPSIKGSEQWVALIDELLPYHTWNEHLTGVLSAILKYFQAIHSTTLRKL